MRRRDLGFRSRLVQITLLCALTLRPLPTEVTERIAEFARGARRRRRHDRRSPASSRRARSDSPRSTSSATATPSTWNPDGRGDAPHVEASCSPRGTCRVADPALFAKWSGLGALPTGHARPQACGSSTGRAGFVFPGITRLGAARCSRSTTGCTCSPTTARRSRRSSRCSRSSRAPTTTCARSPCSPWSSRCSRPATCAPAPACSSTRSGICRATTASRSGSPTRCDAARCCRDNETGDDSIDYLRLDWFALAALPLDECPRGVSRRRRSRPPRSRRAPSGRGSRAGSARSRSTPGRDLAERLGYELRVVRRRAPVGPDVQHLGPTRAADLDLDRPRAAAGDL